MLLRTRWQCPAGINQSLQIYFKSFWDLSRSLHCNCRGDYCFDSSYNHDRSLPGHSTYGHMQGILVTAQWIFWNNLNIGTPKFTFEGKVWSFFHESKVYYSSYICHGNALCKIMFYWILLCSYQTVLICTNIGVSHPSSAGLLCA